MTLAEVKEVRDNYYAAILNLNLTMVTHAIGDASYDHDSHRDSIQKQFEYWDALYNKKSSAGRSPRLDKKCV